MPKKMPKGTTSAKKCQNGPKSAQKSRQMPKSAKKFQTGGFHCIGATIRTRQESQCLPYARFFEWLPSDISLNSDETSPCRQLEINSRA